MGEYGGPKYLKSPLSKFCPQAFKNIRDNAIIKDQI